MRLCCSCGAPATGLVIAGNDPEGVCAECRDVRTKALLRELVRADPLLVRELRTYGATYPERWLAIDEYLSSGGKRGTNEDDR